MLRRRRASVLVWMLILVPVLLALAALAVDIGFLHRTQAQLQSAADSAALAAVSGLSEGPATARARAVEYAALNSAAGMPVVLLPSDVELGRWDAATRTFTVLSGEEEVFSDAARVRPKLLAERETAVPLFLGPALGHSSADVTASAVAQFGMAESWDIFLVQDVSGSFNDELPNAKAALQAFVTCVYEHAGPYTRMGLVPFEVNAWVASPMRLLSQSYESLMQAIQDMRGCCTGEGGFGCCPSPDYAACEAAGYPEYCRPPCRPCLGTSIAAGVNLAASQFPSPFDATAQRAIVLFTDGLPNVAVDGQPGGQAQVPIAMERAVQAVNAAAGMNPPVSVYVVYYGDDPQALSFLASLVRGDGTLSDTPDPAEFTAVFWQLCATFPIGLRE